MSEPLLGVAQVKPSLILFHLAGLPLLPSAPLLPANLCAGHILAATQARPAKFSTTATPRTPAPRARLGVAGRAPYCAKCGPGAWASVGYAIAVLGQAVLFLLDEAVNLVLGGSSQQHWIVLPSLSGFFRGSLFFSIMGVLAGTIGEEFGWRGFAQPRLRKRYGALKASILIGLVWGTFHLWILPICHCMSLTDVIVTQYLRLIATAVIYAWIYNSTKGVSSS